VPQLPFGHIYPDEYQLFTSADVALTPVDNRVNLQPKCNVFSHCWKVAIGRCRCDMYLKQFANGQGDGPRARKNVNSRIVIRSRSDYHNFK